MIVDLTSEDKSDLPEVTRYLKKNQQEFGILECLGYHQQTHKLAYGPYLVFKLPVDLGSPSTLQHTMLKTRSSLKSPGGGHTLESRIRLAHLISESVLFVNTADFVHKNIRTDTILLLRPPLKAEKRPTESLIQAKPYLTYWSMLRGVSTLSARLGDDSFTRNIYRHPHRQGLQLQTRYNIGHDIYSLGVCLLEIGLWEPLIAAKRNTDALLGNADDAYDASEKSMSDIYREMAVRLELVTSQDSESRSALIRPITVEKVLIEMAKKLLPERIGTGYAEIVVACLTCLKGGFGDDVKYDDFEQHGTNIALRFKHLVVEPLAQMY